MKVIVKSSVTEVAFEALPKTLFRELFKTLCKTFCILETWHFGLLYNNYNGHAVWLDSSKKALKDLKEAATKLHFKVKYYPENVVEELIEKSTIEIFFKDIKTAIHFNEIYCPTETCCLLASYELQAKYGNYNNGKHKIEKLSKLSLIPKSKLEQHNMNITEWMSSIITLWEKHAGLDDEEAMLEYLKVVQNLEMYGVTYFDITNKKGTNLLLGVTSFGLNIYKLKDRLNPLLLFPWSEIKRLRYVGKKFIIKCADKKAPDFIFFVGHEKQNKRILSLGVGNHMLYVRRRKPDEPHLSKLKEKAYQNRLKKLEQRKLLQQEIDAKIAHERVAATYQQKLKKMEEDLLRSQNNLEEANKMIQLLQIQLKELQEAKAHLEAEQQVLKTMMEKLQESKNMEAAEKLKLEEEILRKQREVQKIQDEVTEKDEETKRLQEAVDKAKRKEEEWRKQEEERKQEELRREEEERRQEEERLKMEAEHEKELENLPEGANTELPDDEEFNEKLLAEINFLKDKLEETRRQETESEMDKIHRINLRDNKSKYKTLRDIRRGNTGRRVELFENL